MGRIRSFFSPKAISLAELKDALARAEQESRRSSLRMRKLEARRADLVERIRRARKQRLSLEVDALWQDLKLLAVEAAAEYREARVAHLEAVALKRYVHGLERLQMDRSGRGIRRVIERARRTRSDDQLAGQSIRRQEYLEELESSLEALGGEPGPVACGDDDPAKRAFLAEIDAINESAETGLREEASRRRQRLETRLRERAEKGEAP